MLHYLQDHFKVITTTLKMLLGKIIHPLQGVFIPDRLI